ncbi:putative pyruvate kinase [Magnetofaba australis IT-1]|uniref:Pyruvate kinase n=1 Tax=Magnetofaba australis IT-1 TaxID=1434232 RepID=A0A1Y2K1D4_9PROT|nr:putative pyruvate kinase [Magnetofaba australis IT-1]
MMLKKGDKFKLYRTEREGDKDGVYLPHEELFMVMEPGLELLINDGRMSLRVLSLDDEGALCEVHIGGEISDRKGVNVPAALLPVTALTPKDLEDLEFGLSIGVDWCALSFVQRPEDLRQAHELIQGRAKLLAKIEKPQAVDNLEAIIEEADGVMVARGDLAVEYSAEKVPMVQKKVIGMCREAGKPVIVATQMLESMIDAPVPTRAEASDVANAIYDGTDAVMLSAESAVGKYPYETVRMMSKIIETTENDPSHYGMIRAHHIEFNATDGDAISAAAADVARARGGKAICTFTSSGSSATRMARTRTRTPILAITTSLATARQLTLVWGVSTAKVDGDDAIKNFKEMVQMGCSMAKKAGLAKNGERVVIIAGMPFGSSGSTNILRLADVGAFEVS